MAGWRPLLCCGAGVQPVSVHRVELSMPQAAHLHRCHCSSCKGSFARHVSPLCWSVLGVCVAVCVCKHLAGLHSKKLGFSWDRWYCHLKLEAMLGAHCVASRRRCKLHVWLDGCCGLVSCVGWHCQTAACLHTLLDQHCCCLQAKIGSSSSRSRCSMKRPCSRIGSRH